MIKKLLNQKVNESVGSTFSIKMRTSASLLAMVAMGVVVPAIAQNANQRAMDDDKLLEEVVVQGMRSSLKSAQDIKRNADAIVDSIVAEDIGKLPDRSIAEALQRVPGIAVSRFDQPGDPEHFAGEGAGVSIRGLSQVRAELNGRDIFSANDGRSLSFDDVPAELMAGVDVYKTPTADMIEGGLGGIVNLRTRMPFDEDGQVISGTVKGNYGDNIDETNLEGSVLYSNVWDTGLGRFGFLLDLSSSKISSRADNLYNRAFFPVDGIEADTVWVPKGSDWRRNDYYRERKGQYVALQWEPSESTELYLTGFQSQAKRDWYENAFFLDAGSFPEPLPINDWKYNGNNALVSGTLTSPSGIALGTSSRNSSNESKTADLSAGINWVSGAWTINADFQHVKSTAERQDYTLGTVVFPASVVVSDLDSNDGPTIKDTTQQLETLSNYSYGQMMTRPADNEATSNAARLDVQYDFDDVLIKAVKAGVRYSKKEAVNKEASNWSARVQPWNTGAWNPVPTIADETLMEPFRFDDFQRGDANVPVNAWMFKRSAVDNFVESTNAMIAATQPPAGNEWAASVPNFTGNDSSGGANINHPLNRNTQEDKTKAAYVKVDFDLSERIGGNVGLRYFKTTVNSRGAITSPGIKISENPDVYVLQGPPVDYQANHSYSDVLPSMNLRFDVAKDVVLRFSASQAIWRPEFWRTAAVGTLSTEWNSDIPEDQRPTSPDDISISDFKFKFDSRGTNPNLETMKAKQYDLTAEWYFNDAGGSLYSAVFKKDVKDFFRTQKLTENIEVPGFQGEFETVQVTRDSYINIGTADVTGFEIGGTYYFDILPEPLNGFGISANYTYIDSSTNVPTDIGASATDTDGSTIDNLPLEGLAENTYNVSFMYEKYGFFARLAYNYTSEILQTVGPNGWGDSNNGINWKLPIYADDYGQWDLSMGYDITDNVALNFEAYNIGKAKTRGIMQQNEAGDHTAFVYSQDTRYGLSLRVTF